MLEITLIAQPLGICAYIISGVDKDLSLTDVFRGVFPFLLVGEAESGERRRSGDA